MRGVEVVREIYYHSSLKSRDKRVRRLSEISKIVRDETGMKGQIVGICFSKISRDKIKKSIGKILRLFACGGEI